jgi:hypothetical protein
VLLTFFFLPETLPPPLPVEEARQRLNTRFVIYVSNPFKVLGLFRWPNLLCIVRPARYPTSDPADRLAPLVRHLSLL